MLDHAHARAGWSNDRRVTFSKGMHEVQRDGTRLIFKAIVEERLSTTGLFGREDQVHAETLQNVRHILERGRIKLIAEAGDKELGLGHLKGIQ